MPSLGPRCRAPVFHPRPRGLYGPRGLGTPAQLNSRGPSPLRRVLVLERTDQSVGSPGITRFPSLD